MRKRIVAGNWKMNKNLEEGKKLTSEVINIVADELNDDVQVILGTPFIHLDSVSKLLKDSPKIGLSAQNCSEHESGAYTGETSAAMLTSIGAEYVILGHSERREYFGETNEQLAAKTDKAMEHGLTPIFCCGEALDIREAGTQKEYVCQQLTDSLFHLSADDIKKIVIAYEPIWAIGTGKTASAEQAQEMHADIRTHLAGKYGAEVAEEISILYGGSCKPSNAKEIFAGKDVDGGLIGGASLVARDFVDIAKSF
ncbi:triosephosphate isomerase [Fulvitalea axinellae]|uniref:Triosephosphate isomerase n=1 Tax=Fulvitalea axinellae TaxID=1182444 RepID=A0AAU9D9X2_9BACT|nr:triosephosphate isomerase [Fulvitalea axinellae]